MKSLDINKPFYIIDQVKHRVSGHAYECSMTKTIIKTYKTFFGEDTLSHDYVNMIVTRKMCNDMVKYKSCNGVSLTCIDNKCETNIKPNILYGWLQYRDYDAINCKIIDRYITADSNKSPVFDTQNCFAGDGFCSLPSSTVVWNEKIIHDCPFFFVAQMKAIKKANLLISEESNLVFNIIDREILSMCNKTTFFKTSEGLYITQDQSALTLPVNDEDSGDITKFMLADEDMNRYKSYELQRHLSFELCMMSMNSIKIAKMSNSKFFTIKDTKMNDLILYSADNEIYIPKCHKLVNRIIKIRDNDQDQLNMCHEDLPIVYDV